MRTKGRPTTYQAPYAFVARNLVVGGFTQAAVARALGTNASTLHGWMKRQTAFAKAMYGKPQPRSDWTPTGATRRST